MSWRIPDYQLNLFASKIAAFLIYTERRSMQNGKKSERLSGTLTQVLLSPKGVIEGILLSIRGKPVQISTVPGVIDDYAKLLVFGKRVVASASADHSPRTKEGSHPVYKLQKLTKIGTKTLRASSRSADTVVLKGLVAALHYARHGEPNGVVLESGDFVHLRPHGMEKSGLTIGARVLAKGERRLTVLGTTLLEAHEINHVKIA
jgi:hypothetical protein